MRCRKRPCDRFLGGLHRGRIEAGFTLAEAVIVIVILGIISAAVAVFISGPIEAYFDVSRRAQLSDAADTALRRIARDLQRALPNSVRVAGACTGATPCYLEYVPVEAGGRYRAELDQAGGGLGLPAGRGRLRVPRPRYYVVRGRGRGR